MVKPNYDPPADFSVIGPEHNLRRMRLSDFERADAVEGFRYELIEGVLEVSPAPGRIGKFLAIKFRDILRDYQLKVGEDRSFSLVAWEPRLMISGVEDAATNPEPDVAAYVCPVSPTDDSWQGVTPALVIEVVSPHDAPKDYVRNVRLYAMVDTILEYWVVDPTKGMPPRLAVFHRSAGNEPFQRFDVPPRGCYESKHWPGLVVDLAALPTK
ncbi:MAG: Uma2 family endonuclease [Phycisphaerae bacterium]|nr:Uma2 family endonuclease [Phycisphaerae bacterium]